MNGQTFLKSSDLIIPPKNDDIEFTVFGRGYGECILIKYSENDYAVIDCFRNTDEQKKPIIIDYFEWIGESLDKIKCIVVTHWHQDHISGISELVKSSKNATIALSPIIANEQFLNCIADIREKKKSKTSVDDFYEIIDMITTGEREYVAAMNKIVICEENSSNSDHNIIKALAPQQNELIINIKNLNSKILDNRITYDVPDNNELSVVLLFKYDNHRILLGGDMENNSGNAFGWDGIVKNYKEPKSDIYKVAHHGSKTGDHDKIWTDLLEKLPVSILTTFNRGTGIPNEDDINRLMEYSKKLFIVGKQGKNNRELVKLLRKVNQGISIKTIPQNIGIVRYRYNIKNKTGAFETFGEAIELPSD